MGEVELRAPRDGADWDGFTQVVIEGFTQATEDAELEVEFGRHYGVTRVAVDGGRVLGGYVLYPVGEHYGDRVVPTLAVATVCVIPDARRRGVAASLMRDLCEVACAEGAALAPLWAAITRFYRKWGWEVVEHTVEYRVRTSALNNLRGTGELVRNPDRTAARLVHTEHGRDYDGTLVRPHWWDERHESNRSLREHRFVYGWMESGRLTGVVRYRHERYGNDGVDIRVEEFSALTLDALKGMLGFLGSQEAQTSHIQFDACAFPPRPALVYVLPDVDKVIDIKGDLCWMQRVVDIPRALTHRGWPHGVDGRLEFEITDPCRSEPTRWVFEMDRGNASVTPGGSGQVRMGMGAFSGWYAGAISGSELRRLGFTDANDNDIDLLESLTGDRFVWLSDGF